MDAFLACFLRSIDNFEGITIGRVERAAKQLEVG